MAATRARAISARAKSSRSSTAQALDDSADTATPARTRPFLARSAKEVEPIYKEPASRRRTSTKQTGHRRVSVTKTRMKSKITKTKAKAKAKGKAKVKSKATLKPKAIKSTPPPPPRQTFECAICMINKSEKDYPTPDDFPAECQPCIRGIRNIRVCWECARRHVNATANDPWGSRPSCPVCYRHWTNFDILYKYLSEHELHRLETRLTQHSLEADQAFRWCATDKCSSGQFHDIDQVHVDPKICCGECKAVNCFECRVPWHEGMTCKEYRDPGDEDKKSGQIEAATLKTMRSATTKRCTRCRVAVEKTYGCDHMTCGSCGLNFNWSDAEAV